ncbi:MAG: glycosyltransferase [Simkaniaceae bacterium]|nr:glycosyltransferase [Simkaniaceae bacterium]
MGRRSPGVIRVALVHDLLLPRREEERVSRVMGGLYSGVSYAVIADPDYYASIFPGRAPPVTSFIRRLPRAVELCAYYVPLFPLAVEQFDLREYDLVISDSHMVAKGVLTHADQLHVCYCHMPVPCPWDVDYILRRKKRSNRFLRGLCRKSVIRYLRTWDVTSANRPDCYVTDSSYGAEHIAKWYGRVATVIRPPVDTEYFTLQEDKEEYYVTAGRPVAQQKIDMIVRAFSRLPDKRLVVIGERSYLAGLKREAGRNVEFVDERSDGVLRRFLRKARAFVYAAVDGFGLLPATANACGTPVIAYGREGIPESIVENRSGLLYTEQTPEALINAVERFEKKGSEWNPRSVRTCAMRFSKDRFAHAFKEYIEKVYRENGHST